MPKKKQKEEELEKQPEEETAQEPELTPEQKQFEEHVDRCLSVVMHIDIVQQMAEVIKRVHHERNAN